MNTRYILTTLSALLLCLTTACPATEEPAPTSKLDTCDESVDFEDSGWMGPGVGDDGRLLDPQPQYVMGVTAGIPRASEAEQVQFGAHNMRIVEDLFTRDGFIAANLGGSDACRTGRTMSLWRDRDAMMKFVVGDAHRDAMLEASEVLEESKTSHTMYAPVSPGVLPTWEDYHAYVDTLVTTTW